MPRPSHSRSLLMARPRQSRPHLSQPWLAATRTRTSTSTSNAMVSTALLSPLSTPTSTSTGQSTIGLRPGNSTSRRLRPKSYSKRWNLLLPSTQTRLHDDGLYHRHGSSSDVAGRTKTNSSGFAEQLTHVDTLFSTLENFVG